MRKRVALAGIVVAVFLIAAALLVARRHEVIAALIPRIIGAATGYQVSINSERFGTTHGALIGVHVSRDGEPVLDASRIDIWYNPRDLLPGSQHRYGINAISVDEPTVTLVRHKDGSYNVIIPQAAEEPVSNLPQRPNGVPLDLTVRIRDGRGALRAPYALDSESRNLDVIALNGDAQIDTAGYTHYHLSGAFAEQLLEPFSATGTIDIDRGYAMHRVQAQAVPMRAIANYFINSRAARILGGTATDLDFRLYALDVQPNTAIDYHIGGGLEIAGGSIHITGIAQPIEHINGKIQLVSDELFVHDLSGSLAGVPVRVNGGLIDFASPEYHLGIRADADLATLKNAFAFSAPQAISGPAQLAVVVQGPLSQPDVLIHFESPRAVYRTVPLRNVHADVIYQNSIVTFAPLEATVGGGARATLRGTLTIDDAGVHSEMFLHLAGAANDLPYAGEALGAEPMNGDFTLNGDDTDFSGNGILQSARSASRMTALVGLKRGGILTVGPLWIDTERGTLDAAYHLDRTHDQSAFWIAANDLQLHAPDRSPDYGQVLPFMPPITGMLADVAIEGGGHSGTQALVAGALRARDMTIANVGIRHLRAQFAGTLADAAVAPIVADGPWGSIAGNGAFSFHAFAVRGTYHGTLEGLQPFLAGTPASGHIDGTAALAIAPGVITVQALNLALRNATIHGLPLQTARGTLTIENGAVHVESAQATLAGGHVVAAGRYDRGIALVATHLDGAHLRGMGLPLDRGDLSAVGTVAAGAPLPRFSGGFSLANGHAQRYDVTGTGLVDLQGNAVELSNVMGSAGGTYTYADGNIGSLNSGAPVYAMHARVPAGNIDRVLELIGQPTYRSEGTFNADVAIGGAGVLPTVRGAVNVPAGSVNGLPFVDGSAQVIANTKGATARNGSVVIGATRIAFLGGSHPQISGLHARSAQADLEDFNNYFDTGDTLAGTGPFRFDMISQHHRISSNGSFAIDGLRYRNLPIGDTRASWSSARSVVTGELNVSGAAGSMHAKGTVDLATDRPWKAILTDSRYDVALGLQKVDVSTWISALGFPELPVTGKFDADGTIAGTYPRLALNGSAGLDDGTVSRLSIDSAKMSFATRNNRIDITSASLAATGMTASATGELGLRSTDPLHLSVYLNTSKLAMLLAQMTGDDYPVTGTFESTVTVDGTFAKPAYAAAFDATDAVIYGVKVPSIFGSLRLNGSTVELRNAGAQFEHGDVSLAGSLPLTLQPFIGIGPANAPVSLDVAVDDLNPGAFDAFAGNGTKFGGSIDGRIAVSGSVGRPRIFGQFGVANGTYVSSFDLTPVTAITAALTFTSTDATVKSLSAKFGNGTVAGSGSIAFAAGTTFDVKATARGAQVNSPQFGSGTLDGSLALTRTKDAAALLSGNVNLSNTVVPFSAFLAATQSGSGTGPQFPTLPFGLGFDVQIAAQRNVRVRGNGYGAGLDIGATGAVHLAGNLSSPTLDGRFAATSGTLTYFDRAFRVTSARVNFDPSAGILPTLHATGVTHVSNPDPDSARNPYGSTDVTIKVDGPVNQMKIGFDTNPPGYTNDQVLAMIAPFGGLIQGVNYTPMANPAVNGVQPLGALSPVPAARLPGATNSTGSLGVGQEAFNIVNAQFAAGLLTPVETALAEGLGLQNVNVSIDYYGNVGVQATRLLGKTVNLIYSTSFGIPTRQSVGIQLLGARNTSAQLAFYLQNGTPTLFKTTPVVFSSNSSLTVGEPLQGANGFAFTLQRLFW